MIILNALKNFKHFLVITMFARRWTRARRTGSKKAKGAGNAIKMKAAQGDEREPYKWHLTPDMDNRKFLMI